MAWGSAQRNALNCPISLMPMKDPVSDVSGMTYERADIESWFAHGNRTSPLTRRPLARLDLVPNHSLRQIIANDPVLGRGLVSLKRVRAQPRNSDDHVGRLGRLGRLLGEPGPIRSVLFTSVGVVVGFILAHQMWQRSAGLRTPIGLLQAYPSPTVLEAVEVQSLDDALWSARAQAVVDICTSRSSRPSLAERACEELQAWDVPPLCLESSSAERNSCSAILGQSMKALASVGTQLDIGQQALQQAQVLAAARSVVAARLWNLLSYGLCALAGSVGYAIAQLRHGPDAWNINVSDQLRRVRNFLTAPPT